MLDDKVNPGMKRTIQSIIVDSINACKSINRYDLLKQICFTMEDRYRERLDSISTNIGMGTTKDVLKNIDIYLDYYYPKHLKKGLISHEPEASFR